MKMTQLQRNSSRFYSFEILKEVATVAVAAAPSDLLTLLFNVKLSEKIMADINLQVTRE